MAFLQSHLPLISHRIKFTHIVVPLPVISLRMDFKGHPRYDTQQPSNGQDLESGEDDESAMDELDLKATRPSRETSSPLSEASTSDSEGDPPGEKIPKPPGTAGRPHSGGFNLQVSLGWEKKRFTAFGNLIDRLVKTELDPTQCFSKQRSAQIDHCCRRVARKFHIRDMYDNDWPIREALKARLKITSEKARRISTKSKQKKLKEVLTAMDVGRVDDED